MSDLFNMMVSPAAIAIFFKHILGSFNQVITKILMDQKATWLTGDDAKLEFKKPTFLAEMNQLSGFLVILPLFIMQWLKLRNDARLGIPSSDAPYSYSQLLLIILPGSLDIIAQCLSMTGNGILDSSILMVFKGLKVLFSVIISRLYLKTKYERYQWLGAILFLPGVVVYARAVSTTNNTDYSKWQKLGAMGLVLASEFLRAFKGVYEEQMIKGKKMCTKFIACMESAVASFLGIFLLMVFHALPGKEFDTVGYVPSAPSHETGSKENFWNTLDWIRNSKTVQYLVIYIFFTNGLIAYNGLNVTKHLSAMQNSLWSELRLPLVYLIELVMMEKRYSLFTVFQQFVSFAIIFFAGLIFNKKYKLPFNCLYNDQLDEKHDVDADAPTTDDDDI